MEPFFLLDLEEPHHITLSEPGTGPNERRAIRRRRAPWILAAFVVLAFVAWVLAEVAS